MAVIYKEAYDINGQNCGIEHIKPTKVGVPQDELYKVWVGGCSIGVADTIGEARKHLHEHMRGAMFNKSGELNAKLMQAQFAYNQLGDDPFYLGRFMR